MILKPYRRNDNEIEDLKALLESEVDPAMQKIIRQDIRNSQKGGSGEYQVAHNIDRRYGNSDHIGILHDLRIPDGTGEGRYTQIDAVLVNGRFRRAWAIEVKNWGGLVGVDEHEQWWRQYRNGERAIVSSPATQAQYCADALSRWFKANGWPIREVIPSIGFAPEVTLDRSVRAVFPHVFKADLFLRWHQVEEGDYSLWTVLSRFFENRKQPIGRAELERMAEAMLKDHRPLKFDHSSRYGRIRGASGVSTHPDEFHQRILVTNNVVLVHAPSVRGYALKLEIDTIEKQRPNARKEIRAILGEGAYYLEDRSNWIVPQENGLVVADKLRHYLSGESA